MVAVPLRMVIDSSNSWVWQGSPAPGRKVAVPTRSESDPLSSPVRIWMTIPSPSSCSGTAALTVMCAIAQSLHPGGITRPAGPPLLSRNVAAKCMATGPK